MLRVFQNDLSDPGRFVITLELVPGRESTGRSIEQVRRIAAEAFDDGRISAVSITDNPGGNPALSPDAIGHDIFKLGMDVIVHFTSRDMNRVGMESRALQLAMMGMKNILALTGDYTGRGYCGQGAPVFDLDSVNLISMLGMLSDRLESSGDPDVFFPGCAVSPFKYSEGESFAQYAKLCRKTLAGAGFAITQLGYDAKKFRELILIKKHMGLKLPVVGSVYLLTPATARLMNSGQVPGAIVSSRLAERVSAEWKDPVSGRAASVERAARLAAVLKGIGYRGIHIGGVHSSFAPAARLLDRFAEIEGSWREFIPEFGESPEFGFYAFPEEDDQEGVNLFGKTRAKPGLLDAAEYSILRKLHSAGFSTDSPLAPLIRKLCRNIDRKKAGRKLIYLAEDLPKKLLLDCRRCGDCAIEHLAFLCPESKCPKHLRNGACGGSRNGFCEVHSDRLCVWYRAWQRFSSSKETGRMADGLIPPRMWELDGTSSWLNFHLGRDHNSLKTCMKQGSSCKV
jgi:methylenetetrahydrofolate reductase (NADPH)